MARFAASVFAACLCGGSAAADLRLADVWPEAAELRADWEVVQETPTDTASDPDFVEWGVREVETRHYTRHRDRVSEVCSVEIWAFTSEPQAEAAAAGMAYPDWSILREGSLLVMLRGRTWARGLAPRPGAGAGVFDACRRIGEQVRKRAGRLAGEQGALRQGTRAGSGLGPGPS